METNMREVDADPVSEIAARADSKWYAGLLVIGLFFLYRSLKLGFSLVKAWHFPILQSILCINYLLLGVGLIKRTYWARTLAFLSSPVIFLFTLFLLQKYPRAAHRSSAYVLAVMAVATFIYLLIPQVEKEFAQSRPPTKRRDNLAPPPRQVPLTLKLAAVCGNPFMLMSWVLTGFVCCGIAYMLRKAGICVEMGMPMGFAVVWLLLWLFFLGVIGYTAGRLAHWILSSDLRLLEQGILSRATLRSQKKIDLRHRGGSVYHLVFEYEVNGRKYHTWMDTPFVARLLDEAEEPIIYDPQKPGNSILLDELPAHVEIDDTGNLKHRYPFMGFVYLIVPLSTLAGMAYLTLK
ncbi:MAG: hypothetical protein A2X28_09490 [Elusimicrobia bacterium GWA2_56_46]|jgi:hypothetical protein|nr:MAG: hypothetical protein A2X28_09490 [Elusimicrobia bacterium GWA2_56_46]OGR55554.1 MAG: hypothetical protein A2X39_08480 [Elusimicrobia bacterium GWC2_56_31]HBW22044.1 hypothetical protein [Elusimicrobiota bacterium]